MKRFIATSVLVVSAAIASSAANSTQNQEADGLSCSTRVKVAGVREEYEWIRAHYPGANINSQSLTECGSSPTDELNLTTADGRDLTIHFDISSFF